MSDVKRFRCLYYPLTTPDGDATGYGEVAMMVPAADYDALSTQLREARELLRWAIEFAEGAAAAQLGAHQGVGVAFDVNASISYARARDWIARARRVCS